MTRKNKIMAAAAAIALLLLVGSGVARCTLATEDIQEAESTEAVLREEAVSEADPEAESADIDEAADIDEVSGLAGLVGTSWVGADDPTLTLAIVDGAFVEGKEGSNTVTYFTVDSEEESNGDITATVLASKSMTEAASPVLVTVHEEAGRTLIESDALATTYASVQTEPKSLSFTGVTSKLEETLGVDAAKVEAAVASRAAAVSPDAARAIWDAEVWIDFANDTATTSFTLDDGASTIVSVTRNADGSIEAL